MDTKPSTKEEKFEKEKKIPSVAKLFLKRRNALKGKFHKYFSENITYDRRTKFSLKVAVYCVAMMTIAEVFLVNDYMENNPQIFGNYEMTVPAFVVLGTYNMVIIVTSLVLISAPIANNPLACYPWILTQALTFLTLFGFSVSCYFGLTPLAQTVPLHLINMEIMLRILSISTVVMFSSVLIDERRDKMSVIAYLNKLMEDADVIDSKTPGFIAKTPAFTMDSAPTVSSG